MKFIWNLKKNIIIFVIYKGKLVDQKFERNYQKGRLCDGLGIFDHSYSHHIQVVTLLVKLIWLRFNIIVSRQSIEEWFASYETLCEYVVPRSSKKLYEDGEQVMVNVSMFQKVVDTFKMKCRDRKYIVREFRYDEQAIARECFTLESK